MNADEKTMLDLLDRGYLDCCFCCNRELPGSEAGKSGQAEAGEA